MTKQLIVSISFKLTAVYRVSANL